MLKRMLISFAFRILFYVWLSHAFNLVKKMPKIFNEESILDCENYCSREVNCQGFKIREILGLSNPALKNYDCFLLSKSFLNISRTVHRSASKFLNITGFKVAPRNTINGSKLDSQFQSQRIFFHNLVSNPIATDSSTIISFPQHFSRGCSYTISLWVWIWRPKNPYVHEISIFTSRPVFPSLDDQLPLLPAIIANVGSHPDRFFFSLSKDSLGFYTGFTPLGADIKYNEWVHLSLTIFDNLLKVYINGAYIDYLVGFSPSAVGLCPYDSLFVSTEIEASNDSFYGQYLNSLMNNTILQVMGNRGLPSTVGMVQDVWVIRGAALSAEEVQMLVKARPPFKSRSLQQLLRIFDVSSFEDICVRPWQDDFYLSIEWGVCPISVCGQMCIDEAFLLNHKKDILVTAARAAFSSDSSALRSLTARNDAIDSTGSAVFAVDRNSDAALLKKELRMISKSRPARHAMNENGDDESSALSLPHHAFKKRNTNKQLPAIGYTPLAIKAAKLNVDNPLASSTSESNSTSGWSYFRTPPLAGLSSLWNRFMAWIAHDPAPQGKGIEVNEERGVTGVVAEEGPGYFIDENGVEYEDYSFDYADEYGYEYDLMDIEDEAYADAEASDANLTSSSAASNSSRTRMEESSRAQRYRHWLARQEDPLFFVRTAEGRVQSLYRLAMTWLNGREEGFQFEATTLPLRKWSVRGIERAQAALTLALWMSQDLAGERAGDGDNDEPWAFRYPAMLGQPLHVALAFQSRDWIDHQLEDWTRGEVLKVNKSFIASAFGGTALEDLLVRHDADASSGECALVNRSVAEDAQSPREPLSTDDEARLQETDWLQLFATLDPNLTSLGDAFRYLPELAPLVKAGVSAEYADELGRQQQRDSDEDAARRAQRGASSQSAVAIGLLAHSADGNRAESPLTTCIAMAAHYFPVTQYVVSHYGAVDTGVGMLEEVRLLDTSGHPQGFGGEEDLMHQFTEAEALGGDPAAQTWLGKRYFWGWGGLTPDEVAARGWFERAAAQGEPEALYNLGVFHELGQAGFPMDREKSFQYFLRAANAANPFHMALHAVGNHYRYHPVEANHSLAREYYLKAADRDSPEALFSLAMMHKDGVGGPVSVPHCVFYLRWGSSTGFRPLID